MRNREVKITKLMGKSLIGSGPQGVSTQVCPFGTCSDRRIAQNERKNITAAAGGEGRAKGPPVGAARAGTTR